MGAVPMLLEPVDITERWGACKLTRHYVAFVAMAWGNFGQTPEVTAKFAVTSYAYRAADRNGSGSCAWATSAIIFLMMACPNELKFSATMTKALGPPITLVL
jgi:hypothetical protein